ncbi:MAG: DUF4198 domain-containing protein [Ferruginibacter sp.]
MKKLSLVSILVIIISAVFAHEYILLADKFRVKRGEDLGMHLFVSDGFNIQLERPFQKEITTKFELVTSGGSVDLTQQNNGKLPILNRKVDFEGGGLFYMDRSFARIILPTAKFFDYLKEDHIEGIDSIVDKTRIEQRERYTRYIKSLVQSEEKYSDTLYKLITGQRLEIILLQNPYLLKTGDVLQAQVFFEGKPLTGKMIIARNRTGDQPSLTLLSRTNLKGICTFKLTRKGDWFLHATHMIPCPNKNESDWESFWTSYSFGLD